MSPAPLRLAVLISGTGSNLKTLIDARDAGRLNLDIVLVISNRAAAPGLDHARRAGIPITVIGKEDVVEGDTQDAAVRRAISASMCMPACRSVSEKTISPVRADTTRTLRWA